MSVSPSNPVPNSNRPLKRTYGKSSFKHGHTFLETNFDTLMSQFNQGRIAESLGKSTAIPVDKKTSKSISPHLAPTNTQNNSNNVTTDTGHSSPVRPVLLSKQKKAISLPAMSSKNPFEIKSTNKLPYKAKLASYHSRRPNPNLLKLQSSPVDLFGFPGSGSDSDCTPVSDQISLFRRKRNRRDRHSLTAHLRVESDPPLPKHKSPKQEKGHQVSKQAKPRPRPPDTTKSPNKRGKETTPSLPLEIYDVKQPHQCRELGQQQMFRDEMKYLLDCIKQTQPLSTRCLALCSLAAECLSPRFRRQLSFHQLIPQLTHSLTDSPSAPPPLRLAASSLLYALSRDRSSTELDSDTLHLTIQLTTEYTHMSIATDTSNHQSTQSSEQQVKEFELNRAIKTTSSRVSDLLASLEPTETHPLPPRGPICHQLLAAMALQSLISLQKEEFSHLFSEIGGAEAVSTLVTSSLQALETEVDGSSGNSVHKSRFSKFSTRPQTADCAHSSESKSKMHIFLLSNSLLSLNSLTKKHPPSLPQLAATTSHLPHVLFRCISVNRACLQRDPSCQVAYECLKQAMTSVTELCNEVEEFSQVIIESAEFLTSLVECVLTLAPTFAKEYQFDIQIIGLMALVNHLAKSNTSCDSFLQLVSQEDQTLFVLFIELYFVKQREAELLTRELSQVIYRIKLANSPQGKLANIYIHSETDSNDSFNSSSFSPRMSSLSVRDQSSHTLKISLPIEYYSSKLTHDLSSDSTQVLDIPETVQTSSDTDLSMSVKEMSDFIREAATSEDVKEKATANFESSILAAMISLLVGLVASKNTRAQSLLSQRLRLEDFEKMATLLHQMLSFYNLVCDSPVAREKTTQLASEVLRFFTSYL